jgi:hypothetical protein
MTLSVTKNGMQEQRSAEDITLQFFSFKETGAFLL